MQISQRVFASFVGLGVIMCGGIASSNAGWLWTARQSVTPDPSVAPAGFAPVTPRYVIVDPNAVGIVTDGHHGAATTVWRQEPRSTAMYPYGYFGAGRHRDYGTRGSYNNDYRDWIFRHGD